MLMTIDITFAAGSFNPTTSPARGQVGTRGSIDELVLAGSTPVSATMFS
jgi:hypothetical protein